MGGLNLEIAKVIAEMSGHLDVSLFDRSTQDVISSANGMVAKAEIEEFKGSFMTALHDSLGGDGWAYSDRSEDERLSKERELRAGVVAVLFHACGYISDEAAHEVRDLIDRIT